MHRESCFAHAQHTVSLALTAHSLKTAIHSLARKLGVERSADEGEMNNVASLSPSRRVDLQPHRHAPGGRLFWFGLPVSRSGR